jgi:hypothetical protein
MNKQKIKIENEARWEHFTFLYDKEASHFIPIHCAYKQYSYINMLSKSRVGLAEKILSRNYTWNYPKINNAKKKNYNLNKRE